jgi:NTP pyrophosphatase (non-canonical NTP hydrolase)
MKIPKKLRRIARSEPRTLCERAVKLMEEVGELSAEIMRLTGNKAAKKPMRGVKADAQEEAVDVLIMACDIVDKLGLDDRTMTKILNRKLHKWLDNLEKRRRMKASENRNSRRGVRPHS